MKKKTWMLGTLLVIASATVMVGCGGQTSNTTENSANATSNASTNNSSGENNATASDTFTFTLSISNKRFKLMSVVIGNTVRSSMAFPARTHQAPAGSELDPG